MKKFNFLFLLLAGFIGTSAITSCTPEETEDVKPSMTFSTDGAAINADKTVTPGSPLLFKISAIQNQTTKKNLQSLRIQSFKDNTPNIDTTVTINADSYLGSFNFNASEDSPKEEKFTFTLTDKASEKVVKSIVITTQTPGSTINSYNAKLLAGQDNPNYGSYFSVATGSVLKMLAANTTPASVDFVFAYGTTNKYYIGAPSNSDMLLSHPNMVGWGTKNATTFETTSITVAEFDAMINDADFPATVGTDTKVNELAAGNVFAFKTLTGKIGLVKVNDTMGSAAASRAIDIDVKVQQ